MRPLPHFYAPEVLWADPIRSVTMESMREMTITMTRSSRPIRHVAFLFFMTAVFVGLFLAAPATLIAAKPQNGRAARDSAIPGKVSRYCDYLVRQHDRDGNGRLEPEEWRAMVPPPAEADFDGDAILTADELARYVADYGRGRRIRLKVARPFELRSPEMPPLLRPATADRKTPQGNSPASRRQDSRFYTPPGRMPATLPKWFRSRDTNGDGQISLSEYAPKSTESRLKEFADLDANGDGILTPEECRPRAEEEKKETKKPQERNRERKAKKSP